MIELEALVVLLVFMSAVNALARPTVVWDGTTFTALAMLLVFTTTVDALGRPRIEYLAV